MTDKKYTGYGYHGGGRKPLAPEKRHRTNVTICGTLEEISKLKALAKEAGTNVSRFVIETVLGEGMVFPVKFEYPKNLMLADQIRTMYDEGHSYREIAHLLDLRYDEVCEVLNGYEPKKPTDYTSD